MRDWFAGVDDVQPLRDRYRELLKEHHPDNGGDVEVMKEINAEYDRISAEMSRSRHAGEASGEEGRKDYEADVACREILEAIIGYDIQIEIIGTWIWCFGCRAVKDALKQLGFKYAPKKKAWTWHYGEYRRFHRGETPLEEIREKYGSRTVGRPESPRHAIK